MEQWLVIETYFQLRGLAKSLPLVREQKAIDNMHTVLKYE